MHRSVYAQRASFLPVSGFIDAVRQNYGTVEANAWQLTLVGPLAAY
jgi:hypothetical protein